MKIVLDNNVDSLRQSLEGSISMDFLGRTSGEACKLTFAESRDYYATVVSHAISSLFPQ
jgi:hypothetical protein